MITNEAIEAGARGVYYAAEVIKEHDDVDGLDWEVDWGDVKDSYPATHEHCVEVATACLTAAFAAMPANGRHSVVAAFEEAYPEFYYHIAKGKICAGEPLYGAIITTVGTTEIGHGESDISADDALRIAIENAGLTVPALATTEGSDNG